MGKKILVILGTVILAMAVPAKSQEYKTALGLRIGSSNGLTIKHFINERAAVEGLLTTRWDGIIITGLYEASGPAFETPHLAWYFGGGAHLGMWDRGPRWWRDERDGDAIFGLDLILGLEYTFEEIPLNLALDWKPMFNLVGDQSLWADELGLSIRFAFR